MKILSQILCLCSALFLASCDQVAWGTWRYKITVEVQTPEGVKSGSAVRKVSSFARPALLGEIGGGSVDIKGEAVVIDLGERGVVFSLINSGSYAELFEPFPPQEGRATVKGIRAYRTRLKSGMSGELKGNIPTIVMFEDINDPKSVKLVKGGRFNAKRQKNDPVDDFEALFGKGVSLKRVVIEITKDSVTRDIEKWLPWLKQVGGGYLDGRFSGGGPELSNILYGGNFRIGKYK